LAKIKTKTRRDFCRGFPFLYLFVSFFLWEEMWVQTGKPKISQQYQCMMPDTFPPKHSTQHRQPKNNKRAEQHKERENPEKGFRTDEARKRLPKRCRSHESDDSAI
jgi:hypothetical protein